MTTHSPMTIHVALNHVTRYRYDRAVALSPQVVRLRPAPHARTPIHAYSLRVAAREALRQLAAGSAVELARAPRVPREDARAVDRGRPGRRDVGHQPVRLLPRAATPRNSRSSTTTAQLPRARALPAEAAARRRCSRPTSTRSRARRSTTIDFLVELNQQLAQDVRYLIRLEPGVQTPEETLAHASGSCRDSGWLLVQLLRHLGFAARFVSGYLIQLNAGREVARRPVRAADATSPTCTPGARSTCPAPAGSASTRPRACSRAKATSRSPARPSPRAPRRSPALTDEVRGRRSSTQMTVERVLRGAARHQAVHRRAVERRSTRSATRRRRPRRATTCASPWAASRPSSRSTTATAPSGTPRRSGPTQAQLGAELLTRLKAALRAAGPAALRPGQVVSGRAAAALVAVVLLAQGRRAAVERRCAVRRRDRRLRRDAGAGARRSCAALARAARPRRRSYVLPGLRGRLVLPVARAQAAGPTSIRSTRASTIRSSARACARVFEQGLDKVVGHVLPLAQAIRSRAGETGPWFLRDERCYLCPATRRWASACRSIRCRGQRTGDRPDASMRRTRCSRFPAAAAATRQLHVQRQ